MSVLREIVFGAALLGLACGGGEPGTAAAPVVATPGPAVGAVETSLTDLVYATSPRPLRLDLHLPAGQPPFPLVVWVHGGGWSSGTKTLALQAPRASRRDFPGVAAARLRHRPVPRSGRPREPDHLRGCDGPPVPDPTARVTGPSSR